MLRGSTLHLAVGVPPLDTLHRWSCVGETFETGQYAIPDPREDLVAGAMAASRARIGFRAYLSENGKTYCPLCADGVPHAEVGGFDANSSR